MHGRGVDGQRLLQLVLLKLADVEVHLLHLLGGPAAVHKESLAEAQPGLGGAEREVRRLLALVLRQRVGGVLLSQALAQRA